MYSHEQLIEFHEQIRTVKEHLWYDHQEPDMPPILTVRWRDMEPQSVNVLLVGGMIEVLHEQMRARGIKSRINDVPMGAPLVLWSCLGAMADGVQLPGVDETPPKGTPMESIWMACEGYGLESNDEAEMANVQRDDLKKDFETNPESTVLETLTTYQVETSSTGLAEWGRVTSLFHKDDGGRIVWHEPMVHTSEDEVPDQGFDNLLDIMTPHVTREKLT